MNDKNIDKTNNTCTPSDTTIQYFIVILLLAICFRLNRPSSGKYLQKIKISGEYSTKITVLRDPIYIH